MAQISTEQNVPCLSSANLSSMISSMWTLQIKSRPSSLQAATMAESSLSINSFTNMKG